MINNFYSSNEGIVLNTNNEYKIILDFNLGKIKYKNKKKLNICRGAWVKIDYEKDNIVDIKISKLPYQISHNNILFFHAILELLDITTTWNNSVYEIVKLLKIIFHQEITENKDIQLIFLGQLLMLLGITSNIPINLHNWLMSKPMWLNDYNYKNHLDKTKNMNVLKGWLLSTICEYSDFKNLKTLHLFIKA